MITLVLEVENITQAKEYIRALGVDHRKLQSKEHILKWAKELNVEFPNFN